MNTNLFENFMLDNELKFKQQLAELNQGGIGANKKLNESLNMSNKDKIFDKLKEHLNNKKNIKLSEYGTPAILIETELIQLIKNNNFNNKIDTFDLTWKFIESNKHWFIIYIISILNDKKDKFAFNLIFETICELES